MIDDLDYIHKITDLERQIAQLQTRVKELEITLDYERKIHIKIAEHSDKLHIQLQKHECIPQAGITHL